MEGINDSQVNIFCLRLVHLNWISKNCSVWNYFSFLVSSSSFCLSCMNVVRKFWNVCVYLYMHLIVHSWKYGVRRIFFLWISILVFFFWKLLGNSSMHGTLQKNQFFFCFLNCYIYVNNSSILCQRIKGFSCIRNCILYIHWK